MDQYADRTQELANLPIYTQGGRLTTVGDIADVQLVAGPEQINHLERERGITIQVIPTRTNALGNRYGSHPTASPFAS